jgi:hypothetical protein
MPQATGPTGFQPSRENGGKSRKNNNRVNGIQEVGGSIPPGSTTVLGITGARRVWSGQQAGAPRFGAATAADRISAEAVLARAIPGFVKRASTIPSANAANASLSVDRQPAAVLATGAEHIVRPVAIALRRNAGVALAALASDGARHAGRVLAAHDELETVR